MADLKMPDVNGVLIAGNLTGDPSFRKTTNGTPVANFYIASNRKFKDNTSRWRESVCYVGVVAWYKLAESCHENLRKGSAVLIDGELQSRSWKNEDGTSRNVVEIKARRIQFLNKRAHGYESSDLDVAERDAAISDGFVEDNGARDRAQNAERRSQVGVATTGPGFAKKQESGRVEEDAGFDFGYKSLKL